MFDKYVTIPLWFDLLVWMLAALGVYLLLILGGWATLPTHFCR